MKQKTKVKKGKVYVIILLLASAGLFSCNGNDVVGAGSGCGVAWSESIQGDLNKYLEAIGQYSNNPTVENCNNYKKALQGYINSLKKVKKCVPSVSISVWNQTLKEAEEEVNNIDCSS